MVPCLDTNQNLIILFVIFIHNLSHYTVACVEGKRMISCKKKFLLNMTSLQSQRHIKLIFKKLKSAQTCVCKYFGVDVMRDLIRLLLTQNNTKTWLQTKK